MSTETQTQLKQFKINRDGFPPLSFTGAQIAAADNRSHQGPNQNRWTTVRIYRTTGGNLVCSVKRSTQWQGESDHTKAASMATAKEAITWLQEGEDRLGGVSQEAIEEAAKVDPEFAAAFVEQVD